MSNRSYSLHFLILTVSKQNGRTRFSECCLQARRGEFTDTVHTAIIPALLDGGLVFILRWSLDDNTETTIAAAVNCFHSMLVSEQDEVCVFDFEVVQRSNSKSRAKALHFCNVETVLVQSDFAFQKEKLFELLERAVLKFGIYF